MRVPSLLAASLLLAACGSSAGVAPPELPAAAGPSLVDAFSESRCTAARPPDEPDLMAWDAGSRATLAMLRTQGVVAVRYTSARAARGCGVELEILPNCIGAGHYAYVPYVAADTKIMRGERDLYAALPVGAARLGGQLHGGRALRTDYNLVGMVALPPGTTFPMSDLHGAGCETATHVVSRVYLGGFAMVAGEERTVRASARFFGAGLSAGEGSSAERLVSEGVAEACVKSKADGKENPLCAVPLRVGLLPIVGTTPGGCPAGTSLEGKECIRRRVVTEIECPEGTRLTAGKCLGVVDRSCPSGLHFDAGAGCVPDTRPGPPPPPRPIAPRPRPPRGGELGFYFTKVTSSGLSSEAATRAVLERGRAELRRCVLEEHLEDEWSMTVSITFSAEGYRLVGTRAFHRGVDATETFIGDALVSCGGLSALWPWPLPDGSQLATGEHAFVQLEAGMRYE